MLTSISFTYLNEYLCYFIGGLIQIIFILLPVTLKNWEDDALNALSYVSFQLFFAAIIFIVAPWIFEVKTVTLWSQSLLFFGTGFVAIFRVIKLIPFEFTFPIKLPVAQNKNIVFTGFNTRERHNLLLTLNYEDVDAQYRYNSIRERLIRIKQNTTEEDSDDDDLNIIV